MAWQRLARKTIYDTKHLKLYEDTVELESGKVFDDYSVVTVPDSVMIVATTDKNELIVLTEYKYAVDADVLTLPAGSIDSTDGDVVVAARRELLEETGYDSDEAEIVEVMNEYPSKFTHTITVVRIKNAQKIADPKHEVTESIGSVILLTQDYNRSEYKFSYTAVIAALAKTLPEYIIK